MSLFTPGSLLRGANWNYCLLTPVKGDGTHTSTVFKAKVIPRHSVHSAPQVPQWALIKVASSSDATAMVNMDRERQTYRLPGVAASKCFRKLYDAIDDHTLALEWLDTTLAEVKYQPDMRTYALIRAFLRPVLSSCVVPEDHKCVNTDYKPANILLSGVGTGQVTAKVGDLGLVVPVGHLFNAQPYAMRAPEVFLGHACTEQSQVRAVAAMLLSWIKPGILGAWDSPHFIINESWSMAKMKRLFPHWKIPTPGEVEGDILKARVNSGISLSEEVPELQAILPLDEETQKMEMPQQLRDLLRFMLVPNPVDRPSASSVLASRKLQAFERYVDIQFHQVG